MTACKKLVASRTSTRTLTLLKFDPLAVCLAFPPPQSISIQSVVNVESTAEILAEMAVSVEYATMVECFEALVLGISQDPQTVANKLLSVGLAPPNLVDRTLLQPRENYDKATEIVLQVMKKVEGSSGTLEVFMSILADIPSLHDLVGSLHEKYERNKNEVRCVKGVQRT